MNCTRLFFLSLIALTPGFSTASPGYAHEGPILIRNVSIIDGLGSQPSPMRDILIEEGSIISTAVTGMIGSIPDDTEVIDGDGLTVLPGLIDLHIHLGGVTFRDGQYDNQDPADVQKTLNAHLYAGVTSVQDLGSDHDFITSVRDEIERGERVGPTIFATGDTIHRLQAARTVFALPSEEAKTEIEQLLDRRQEAGIRTIKLYAGLSNWSARHIVTEARKRDMRVIADFWCSNLGITVFRVTDVDGFAHGSCHEVSQEDAEWMHDNDKFAMMTLTIFDILGGHRQYRDFETRAFFDDPLVVDPLGKQVLRDYYDAFRAQRETFEDGEQSLYRLQLFGDLKHLLATNQRNVLTLHEAGVLIGIGTDAAFPPGNWPGEAMHFEMAMHVEAGIDPIEVIRMATYNGAQILRAESEIGSIEPGKVADVLIVRGDPSTDINDTRNVEYVIKAGKLVDRNALVSR